MTVSPTRPPTSPGAVPTPRAAEPDIPSGVEAPSQRGRGQAKARHPWPEPWRPGAGSRPRTEYWDVATASWQAVPVPRPRPEA